MGGFRVGVGIDIKKASNHMLVSTKDAGSTISTVAFFAIDLCYLSF